MIVDILQHEITTVWLGFDDFEDEHMENTVTSAKEWLRDHSGWFWWRFESLNLDWDRRRVEIDFLRMQPQC